MNPFLHIHPEVQDALHNNKPVVALESTIIAHGMPYPQNVQTALEVEAVIREQGAVPATIAVLEGKICIGLSR
ncbi:MAG: pseudouridine-5'-phosphate glycosidase, partial [Bacteroidota bacterium]